MERIAEPKKEEEHYDVLLDDIDGGIRPRKVKVDPKKKTKNSGWGSATAVGEIGFDIALPMVLGLVVGTKLDDLWGTRPKATLVLFFTGLIIGCTSLIRIVYDSLRK